MSGEILYEEYGRAIADLRERGDILEHGDPTEGQQTGEKDRITAEIVVQQPRQNIVSIPPLGC